MKAFYNIPIVVILAAMGYTPLGESMKTACYDLGLPQGLVNIDKESNRWHFFDGSGGGNNVALVSILKGMPLDVAADWIATTFLDCQHFPMSDITASESTDNQQSAIRIVRIGKIKTPNLLKRIERDGIPLDIALQYCVEIAYCSTKKGTTGYGYGLRNQTGGYGIITYTGLTVNVPFADVAVVRAENSDHERSRLYMGIRDYLSNVANDGLVDDAVIIFNAGLVERAIPYIEGYDEVVYFVPNTRAKELTMPTIKSHCKKVTDMSPLYSDYRNYHQWYLAQAPKKAA